jgi:uncharacterized delta-60 repeat protein
MVSPLLKFFRLGMGALAMVGICGHGLAAHGGDSDANHVHPAEVYALTGALGGVAIQPDGKIVVATGSCLYSVDTNSGIWGMKRSGAFRFKADGTLDRSFQCNIDTIGFNAPDSTRLVSDQNGRLLMTGPFHSVDGKPRPGYAMLQPDGQLDESFEPWRGFTNPPARLGVGAGVYWVALLSNGCVSVASFMFDAPYPTAHSLDAAGRYVPPATPSQIRAKFPREHALVYTLTPTGLGIQRRIDWTKNTRTKWNDWPPVHPPSGLPFPQWGENPSALDMSEALQTLFEEVPLELCRYTARLPNGGFILAVQWEGGSRFMRFDKNWLPDLGFTNRFETDSGSFLSLAVQPDGKLLVAGAIAKLNGENFTGLARLDQTGATDRSFHCQTIGGASTAGKSEVMALALQGDGKIVIAGWFSEVNGVKCPHLARLNPDGSLDQHFHSHFTSYESLVSIKRRVPVVQLAKHTSSDLTMNATNSIQARAVTPGQTLIISSINMADVVAVVRFQGAPNQAYILQARNALDTGDWFNVTTNRTDASGSGVLRDPGAKEVPSRFYRLAAP